MIKSIIGLNPYVIIAVIALCFALWWHGWYAGKAKCENAQLKQTVKVVEKVRYVRQKTDAMPSGAVYDGLQRWTR